MAISGPAGLCSACPAIWVPLCREPLDSGQLEPRLWVGMGGSLCPRRSRGAFMLCLWDPGVSPRRRMGILQMPMCCRGGWCPEPAHWLFLRCGAVLRCPMRPALCPWALPSRPETCNQGKGRESPRWGHHVDHTSGKGPRKPRCSCRTPRQMGTAHLDKLRDQEGRGSWGVWPHCHWHRPPGKRLSKA